MQNEKTEGVNDEQRNGCGKTLKTETRRANEQATKNLVRRRNKLIWLKQNNNKESTLRSYTYQALDWLPCIFWMTTQYILDDVVLRNFLDIVACQFPSEWTIFSSFFICRFSIHGQVISIMITSFFTLSMTYASMRFARQTDVHLTKWSTLFVDQQFGRFELGALLKDRVNQHC